MSLRDQTARLLETPFVRYGIIGVILFNAVILGLETSDRVMAVAGPLIYALDTICLAIFVAEIAAKLFAYRLSFFRSGWNIFDFVIVGIALIPAAQSLSVLRALRILRVLRVISATPSLRRVVEGFLTALPGMGSVFMLMSLIFYIGSVMATKLFGDAFPQWFGDLGSSAYSLFQIMTLESWSMGIVRPGMQQLPYAWALFVPFIITTAFTVLNLFIGVIVDAMQSEHEAEARADRDAMMSETELVLEEVRALRKELKEMGLRTAKPAE
ncbi:MAG: ion transporter [Rhizobiales bacterium]|nr:ion transporter [Hyphomicrobiales bacterium]